MTKGRFGYSVCAKGAIHQAANLAKLWQEFLSLLELIAKIFCAVVIAKTSEVGGNRHCVYGFYLGDSHVALLLGMTALWAIAIT